MNHQRSSTLIAQARQKTGLTQAAFASRAGTSQPAIARYEAGLASPSIDTLIRILKAGGLELELRVKKSNVTNLCSARAKKIRENRGEINRLMKAAGASHVRIFGSVVRGEDTKSSDIDFLVEFDTSNGVVPLIKLKTALSSLLHERVDVAPVSLLKKSVLENALKEALPLWFIAITNIGLRDFLAHQYFKIELAVIKASIDQPLEDVRLACVAEQLR